MKILCSSFIQKIFAVMEHCPPNQGLRFFPPIQSIPISREIVEENQEIFSEQIRIFEKYSKIGNEIPVKEKHRLHKLELKLWKKEYLWRRTHLPPKKLLTPCVFVEGPITQCPAKIFKGFTENEPFKTSFSVELFCFKSYNLQKNEKRTSKLSAAEWREKTSALYSTATCYFTHEYMLEAEVLAKLFKDEGYTNSILAKMIHECGIFLRTQEWQNDCGFMPLRSGSNVISYEFV